MAITSALQRHWPEYLIELGGIGILVVVICCTAVAFEHPSSPLQEAIGAEWRRPIKAAIISTTIIGLVYSPWGKQSGAHFNPAITLTFLRLGKVAPLDAVFYMLAHFSGAVLGAVIASIILFPLTGSFIARYALTAPGGHVGSVAAFLAEVIIGFIAMSVILKASNTPRVARFTGVFAATLIAAFIIVEAPLSGMSMNPARSFGPAAIALVWTNLWIYLTAPLIGMLLAGELHRWRRKSTICAKLHHHNDKRCIFRHCGYKTDAAVE